MHQDTQETQQKRVANVISIHTGNMNVEGIKYGINTNVELAESQITWKTSVKRQSNQGIQVGALAVQAECR